MTPYYASCADDICSKRKYKPPVSNIAFNCNLFRRSLDENLEYTAWVHVFHIENTETFD